MVQMLTLSIQTIFVDLMILSLNLIKYTHWNCHCSCSLLYQQPGAIWMGRLNPNLSFFGGVWDSVVILVEGHGSLAGGWGCLGELFFHFYTLWAHIKNANVTSWCNTFTGIIASAAAMSLLLGLGVTEVMMFVQCLSLFLDTRNIPNNLS